MNVADILNSKKLNQYFYARKFNFIHLKFMFSFVIKSNIKMWNENLYKE